MRSPRQFLRQLPGVRIAGRSAVGLYRVLTGSLLDAQRRRDRKAIVASGLFDPQWYLKQYPDVAAAGLDPLDHYLTAGGYEGRNPSARFDSHWYLEQNPDVFASRLNPLLHYVRRGAAEGRSPAYVDLAKIERFVAETKSGEAFRQLMADGPLVSIVLATKNRREEVLGAIRSVLAQSYPHWELLVVDDGSIDDTVGALGREIRDPRVIVIPSEPRGVSGARNIGLARSKGEFITYLDSDNAWTPDFLAISLAHLVGSDAEFCYAGVKCQIEPERFYYRFNPFDYDKLVNRNFIDLNVILHRRALYERHGGFDESLRRMVDWDLVIRYTKDANVVFAPFIGAIYDDSERDDRITKREGLFWKYVILNKHLIDWNLLRTRAVERDPSLTSIVIPIYGQAELTQQCLESLFSRPAGAPFEVVLVDNGSDAATAALLDEWVETRSEVRLVRNSENLNFALGCNLGFAASRGGVVVFLNNDTLLSEKWLLPLVSALQDPEVGAVQPKLVYPDQTIQCIGVTFSRHSAIGYPIYANHPADAPYVNVSSPRQAVTAACMAVRATDFAALSGFDTRFINGQEDVDFCLRLRSVADKTCWYAAESVVVHQESKTPGRGLHIRSNRRHFQDLWADRIVVDDVPTYEKDGFRVGRWDVDNRSLQQEGLGCYRPHLVGRDSSAIPERKGPLRFALKIGCPTPAEKEEWGDYHMARSLGLALERLGCRYRIDFLNEWDSVDEVDDVNLVFRGLSEFRPPEGSVNLMWLISHPDKVTEAELQCFDHVFIASNSYAAELQNSLAGRVSPLLQCTDPELFRPDPSARPKYNALFVGNSRNVFRRAVKDAVEQGIDITVVGTRWRQFISSKLIKGENIPNAELAQHYAAARVVLNDHWPDMRDRGFVSNRIFDVLACGAPLVSDEVAGLPEDLKPFVTIFGDEVSLKQAVESVLGEDEAGRRSRIEFAADIRRRHSFDQRARIILETASRLINHPNKQSAEAEASTPSPVLTSPA